MNKNFETILNLEINEISDNKKSINTRFFREFFLKIYQIIPLKKKKKKKHFLKNNYLIFF